MLYLAVNAPEALVTRSYYGAPRARGSPHPNLLGSDLDHLSSSARGRDPPPRPFASTPQAMIMACLLPSTLKEETSPASHLHPTASDPDFLGQ